MRLLPRHLKKLSFRQKIILVCALVLLFLLFWFAVILGPFRTFFWHVPSMSGFLGPQKYLILLQNESELRPTGGFISAYGVLTMAFGIPFLEFHDSYDISTKTYVEPPYPFKNLIGNDPFYGGWQFRDANFSPDFPTSVQQILNFYNKQYPEVKFAGVIALDFTVIEDMLRHFGDMEVSGTVFTAQNFFINIQRASKNIDLHDEEALKNRKGILSEFGKKLMSRVIFSPTSYSSMFDIFEKNLHEKHIQIYFNSPSLQKKLEKRMWNGVVFAPSGSDFLHINVANIGGRKADRYVQKRYEYTVTFPINESGRVKLTERFIHQGDYNLQSDRYQAYIRTYVPFGSKLVRSSTDATDKVQIGNELGATYFGNTIVMMPGEQRELVYEYTLPEDIHPESYALALKKQAGVIGDDYLVTVRMPNDHPVTDKNSDQSFTISENIAVWRGLLSSDLNLRLQNGADVSPPMILWQRFRSPTVLEIRWNEDISPGAVTSLAGFTVNDLNNADQVTESVSVTRASLEGRDLLLRLSGMGQVVGEHYRITLRNVSDISGNMTDPNPLEITAVYRTP